MTTHCKWALSQNVFSHVCRLKVRCKNFTIHAASALKKRKGYRVYVCVFETFLQRADWVWSICGVWEMLLSLRQQMRQMERKMMKKGGRKKREKLSVILQMQGHFLVFLYTNFHSSICSIFQSQYQYRVIHNDWRLLRTFRFVEVVMSSHEHKLIGAFHLLLLDRTMNMPLIISE